MLYKSILIQFLWKIELRVYHIFIAIIQVFDKP